MAITTHKKISLYGIDITSSVISFKISKRVGAFAHTLDIRIAKKLLANCTEGCTDGCIAIFNLIEIATKNKDKWFKIELGTDVYNFWIIENEVDDKENYKIIAKSKGCFLEYPFSADEQREYVGTANQIITQLCNEEGITSNINIPNFDLAVGGLKIIGTKGDLIKNICAVTGANFYQHGDDLHFIEALRIEENPTPILTLNSQNKEIEFINTEANKKGSKLVRSVTFNAKNKEIIAEPRVAFVTDGCGEYLFFTPMIFSLDDITEHNLIPRETRENWTRGCEVTIKEFSEYYTLEDERVIYLAGGIESIQYVLVDGVATEEYVYEYGYNTIVLNDDIIGEVKVRYRTNIIAYPIHKEEVGRIKYYDQVLLYNLTACVDNAADPQTVGDINNSSIDCKLVVENGFTKESVINILHTPNSIKTIVAITNPLGTLYPVSDKFGIKFKSIGASGVFDVDAITEESKTDEVQKSKSFIYQSGDDILVDVPKLSDPYEFRVKNDIASPTKVTDGLYKLGDANAYGDLVGLYCEFLYLTTVNTLTLPRVGADSPIVGYSIVGCSGESEIFYPTGSDGEDLTCLFPQNRIIDILGKTGKDISFVRGKVLPSSFGDLTVDDYGKVLVVLEAVGTFIINVGSIIPGATIEIIVVNTGGA